MSGQARTKTIVQLVSKRGFVEVLFSLEEERRRFNELRHLKMSPNTIVSHLRHGEKLGLIRQELERHGVGRAKITYALTPKGKQVVTRFAPIKDRFMQLRSEMDDLERSVREREDQVKFLLSSLSTAH